MNKDKPVSSVHSFEEILSPQSRLRQIVTAMRESTPRWRWRWLQSVFFGVISYAVSRRTSEIGVRMALGARSADVAQPVLRPGVFITAIGIAVGAGGRLVFRGSCGHNFMRSVHRSYLAVASLMAVVIMACLIPARRATKIDPMVALRIE